MDDLPITEIEHMKTTNVYQIRFSEPVMVFKPSRSRKLFQGEYADIITIETRDKGIDEEIHAAYIGNVSDMNKKVEDREENRDLLYLLQKNLEEMKRQRAIVRHNVQFPQPKQEEEKNYE